MVNPFMSSLSTNPRIVSPQDVFYQISSTSWSPVEIVNTYLNYYKGYALDEIERALINDLQEALQKKRGAPTDANDIKSKFALVFHTIRETSQSPSAQPSCSSAQPSCSSAQPSCSSAQPSCSSAQPSQPSCSSAQPSLPSSSSASQSPSAPQSSSSTAYKTADQWNSYGNVTQKIINKQKVTTSGKKRSHEQSASGIVSHEIAKKKFSFVPPTLAPSISANKPRVRSTETQALKPVFIIKINDTVDPMTPQEINEQYHTNMNDQAKSVAIKELPKSFAFLESALKTDLVALPRFLWTHGYEDDPTLNESQVNELIRLVLTDYYANCNKPAAPISNERTPYIDHVIPLFKYFASATKLMSLVWCEKSLPSHKLLGLCLPDDSSKKLVDGLGMTVADNLERILLESSGETDGDHSVEDTVKLMECASKCLRAEMNAYRQASFATFLARRVLCVHYIGDKLSLLSVGLLNEHKWSCISVRSAIIPRTYTQRHYWLPAFELMVKLKSMLEEQNALTDMLVQQHTGWVLVEPKDRIENQIASSET